MYVNKYTATANSNKHNVVEGKCFLTVHFKLTMNFELLLKSDCTSMFHHMYPCGDPKLELIELFRNSGTNPNQNP